MKKIGQFGTQPTTISPPRPERQETCISISLLALEQITAQH